MGSPWPDAKQAAVSITMDNMGEAAAIQRGEWPVGQQVGHHRSVLRSLPNILDLLDELDVRVTYFIEGWNVGVYPDAIREVSQRGHEVAVHGWQHEPWSGLDPESEERLVERSTAALRGLDIEILGFRPPGGMLTGSSIRILSSRGLRYCSPAGKHAAFADDMVFLPFDWQGIDAYYYVPGFAGLRKAKGDPTDVLAPADFAERVSEIIDRCVEHGSYVALLFHPFLEEEPERIAAMVEILRLVTGDERIWCAPCRDVADWVREHSSQFGTDPGLDSTSWSR